MVTTMNPEITINFIAHDEIELLALTLPQNIQTLAARTSRLFDLCLTIDGAETAPVAEIIAIAQENGIDEIRLRYRRRNCATGDPSNNGHMHGLHDKTPYLLTLESDICIFRIDPAFDILDAAIRFLDRHPEVPLLHRMDDTDCWQWQLEKVAEDIEPGVWSVNRLSSHFLVYRIAAFREVMGWPTLDTYHDDGTTWLNVEDFWSKSLAAPAGPGIPFVASWPMRVYHCDEKIAPESAHYRRDLDTKLRVFHHRCAEVNALCEEMAIRDDGTIV